MLVDVFRFRMPLAIDGLDNAFDSAFAAWPERLYVLAPGGTVVYKGGMGPFGFDTEGAETALVAHLAR